MIDRLRRLLTSAPGRRLAAVLVGAVLLAQFVAAGHLHLPGHELEHRGAHAVCAVCIAADRTGVAPPAITLRLPPGPAAYSAAPAPIPVPVSAAPAAYSSRAPPHALA